jgi:hypothetical protein
LGWALQRIGDVLRLVPAARDAAAVEGGASTQTVQVGGVRLTLPYGWIATGGRMDDASRRPGRASSALLLGQLPAGAALTVREWRAGDRFRPAWHACGPNPRLTEFEVRAAQRSA